jgi:hypothetical protein
MIKAGVIGAGFGFIYIMSLALLLPLCTLCFSPLLGMGVGYLAGWFDKPLKLETSLGKGGIAGGIASVGVVAGQILANIVYCILVTNSTWLQQMGFIQANLNQDECWQITLTLSSFCGLFNLVVIVGLAAIGSLVWFQRYGDTLVMASSQPTS